MPNKLEKFKECWDILPPDLSDIQKHEILMLIGREEIAKISYQAISAHIKTELHPDARTNIEYAEYFQKYPVFRRLTDKLLLSGD